MTPTQAVIHVTATNADGSPFTGHCLYRVSEGSSFSAPVNDVNPALFPGSNSDERPGSVVNGKDRFFVAGTRTAGKAPDGKFYSRALQAATQHWVGVTCGTGGEKSASFTTQNPPLGNAYPEFPHFDPAAFGNRAEPTIDFIDKSKSYIDPLTGILLKRITGPLDRVIYHNTNRKFSYARDVAGNGWHNPQSVVSEHPGGTLASTETPNAPLFLAWSGLDTASTYDANQSTDDLRLRSVCSSPNGAVLEACISLDSGNSCATDTVEWQCPRSAKEVAKPNNYPSPMFNGWGRQKQALSKYALSNQPPPSVLVMGNRVTWVGGNVRFNTERTPGTKIFIEGTDPTCPANVCTIKSVDSPFQITIEEKLPQEFGGSGLTSAAATGAASINLRSARSLFPGNHIRLEPGTPNEEMAQASAAYKPGSTTVPLTGGLSKPHPPGSIAYWAGLDDGTLTGPNPPGHVAEHGTHAGATSITLIDTSKGLAPGETIVIDLYNPTEEWVKVASNFQIGSLTVPLETPLLHNHSEEGYTPYVGWSNAVKAHDLGAGVRVWMKNTGFVSASFTFDHVISDQYFNGNNAEYDTCSPKPITDINTDRLGSPISPPLSGYLCSFAGAELQLWIPSTGESRLMSTYYQEGVGRMLVPNNPFSEKDSKTFFATNSGNGHLYRAVLKNPAGVYKEYKPGTDPHPARDHVEWTDLTAATKPIDQQLAQFGGPVAADYATGLFPPIQFVGVIGGYAIYDTASAYDGPCMKIRAEAETNRIVQAFDSWHQYPARWGGCHSAPLGAGSLLNLTLNTIQDFDRSRPLGGPYVLRIKQMKRGANWRTWTQPISSASNSKPAVFTMPKHGIDPYFNTNFGAGPDKGPPITISGGTGNWAAANGTWTATVTLQTPTSFSIPLDTTNFGPVTGKLTITTAPPLIHSKVVSVSAATPAVVTTFNNIGNEPPNHRFEDGDPIGFGNLPANKQFYAKVSGYSSTTFAVYADPQLTRPVSSAELAKAKDGMVYFAETCPADLPDVVTTKMKFDSGAHGVRCITVRVAGEPCTAFATGREHSKMPCKADPTNTSKASLADVEVGDAIRDIARIPYDETMVVVKKVKHSESDIEITLMRWYGDKIGGDNHVVNPSANSHDAGWTPIMVPSNSHGSATGWVDAKDPQNTFMGANPDFAGTHGDVGYGKAPGLFTYVGGAPDSIVNKPIRELLDTPLTYTKKEGVAWANEPNAELSHDFLQSYPGHRQIHAPEAELAWKGDWFALNPSFGNGQTESSGLINGIKVQLIRGTQYDPHSETNLVYKISNPVGAFDRKRTPTYAWAGKFIFRDMSGPGSVIRDTDLWSYCVADNPGECRPGSTKNDVFLAGSAFADTNGWCLTNTFNVTAPCFIGANPLGGWAVQVGIDPIDTTGRRVRRLTLGFGAPGLHWTFTTWLQSPDGKWGFFSVPYANGLRNDYFAMKLPPWPSLDSEDRTNFIKIPVHVEGGAPYARARFGYVENGAPGDFFCTSRHEACSTEIPAREPKDPYSFVGEAATHANCQAGCTIALPAVPGRVLYYVIDRLDAAGKLAGSGTPGVVAVP